MQSALRRALLIGFVLQSALQAADSITDSKTKVTGIAGDLRCVLSKTNAGASFAVTSASVGATSTSPLPLTPTDTPGFGFKSVVTDATMDQCISTVRKDASGKWVWTMQANAVSKSGVK